MSSKKKIKIIGVPMDLGSGRRGVDMGPSAFRIAGVGQKLEAMGFKVLDSGDINVANLETQRIGDPTQRYMIPIAKTCDSLRRAVEKAMNDNWFPLVLGGDHSMSVGTVAAASNYFKKQDQSMGLIWFDAHGDMNTPTTSPSGNVHGMPLSAILGYGSEKLTKLGGDSPMVEATKAVLIGVRTLDELEKELVRNSGIRVFTMSDIDRMGMNDVMKHALDWISADVGGLHVSFDLDVLDPQEAPGVGTSHPGGLTYREAHLAMEMISEMGKLTSLEIVELNPTLDSQNMTANTGVDLIMSAFGNVIL